MERCAAAWPARACTSLVSVNYILATIEPKRLLHLPGDLDFDRQARRPVEDNVMTTVVAFDAVILKAIASGILSQAIGAVAAFAGASS